MANGIQAVWAHAQRRPDAVALRVDGAAWNYREFRDESSRWAGRLLAAGVKPGDRVLLTGGTRAEWVFAYHGILAIGALAVTVNQGSTIPELRYFLEDSGAVLALADDGTWDKATRAAGELDVRIQKLTDPAAPGEVPIDLPRDVAPDAGAVIIYTSGTTGQPKGAQLTHHGLRASAQSLGSVLEVTQDDHFGTALPLFHVFGQVTILRIAYEFGSSVTLMSKFDATALLETAERYGITVLAGVPTMWNAMANLGTEVDSLDLSALRIAVSGGAGLPLEVASRFERRYGCEILAGYGLTESAGAGACPPLGGPKRPGSAGIAEPGVEFAIFDPDRKELPNGTVGEIGIRCETNLKSYWNRPEATANAWHEDWLLTGDLGRLDDDGFLWVVDRIKDMIIRGGYNVYPKELEEALYAHPDVLEAAVVGVPDQRLGEEIAAVIVLREGREFDVASMQTWMSERIAGYKTPRIYHVVPALPKGSTGKILKREIDRGVVDGRGFRTARNPSTVRVP